MPRTSVCPGRGQRRSRKLPGLRANSHRFLPCLPGGRGGTTVGVPNLASLTTDGTRVPLFPCPSSGKKHFHGSEFRPLRVRRIDFFHFHDGPLSSDTDLSALHRAYDGKDCRTVDQSDFSVSDRRQEIFRKRHPLTQKLFPAGRKRPLVSRPLKGSRAPGTATLTFSGHQSLCRQGAWGAGSG